MKQKRILGIAAFFAGLALLLQLSSALLLPKGVAAAAGTEEAAASGIQGEPENSIDVLVLGDSEAYSAISPLLLWKEKGYTSFVCGTSNQRLPYSYNLLRKALETQKPRFVILETLAVYRHISPGNMELAEVARFFPVFQYHDRWKASLRKGFGGDSRQGWTSDNKGYFYSSLSVPAHNKDYMAYTAESAKVPAANRRYLQRIRALCAANGAELLLLSTPSTKNWDQRSHNGIAALAQELGCAYVDLNLKTDKLGIDWSRDTRDRGDHMNDYGAVKVTRFLAQYLSEKGKLTDHRGDAAFAAWHDCLKKLETIIAEEQAGRAGAA